MQRELIRPGLAHNSGQLVWRKMLCLGGVVMCTSLDDEIVAGIWQHGG
jgi:hypothetical protein